MRSLVRWRRLRHYDRPGAWVRRVAIRDAVRAAQRSRRFTPASLRALPAEPAASPDEELIAAVHALPAQQRAAIVAWGVAPPGSERVRLTFDERTVEARTVAYGPWMAFAVDVGEVAGEPRMTEALDGAGEVNSAVVGHPQGSCVEAGNPSIDLPNVVGMPLWEAVRAIESAGFSVLGTGTPPEDPIDPGATISAQEPPAGTRLPEGACVGFRTTSG